MEVEFSLIPEDFVAARSCHNRRHWKQLIFLHVAAIILLASLSVVPQIRQAGLVPVFVTLVIFISIHTLIFLILYLNRHRLAVSQMAKFLRQGKNAKLLEPQQLTISPERISQSSADSAGITMWTGIEKIAVAEDHVFFYVSTQRAIILPRRAFAREQDFRHFVETARGYFEATKEFEAANKEPQPA